MAAFRIPNLEEQVAQDRLEREEASRQKRLTKDRKTSHKKKVIRKAQKMDKTMMKQGEKTDDASMPSLLALASVMQELEIHRTNRTVENNSSMERAAVMLTQSVGQNSEHTALAFIAAMRDAQNESESRIAEEQEAETELLLQVMSQAKDSPVKKSPDKSSSSTKEKAKDTTDSTSISAVQSAQSPSDTSDRIRVLAIINLQVYPITGSASEKIRVIQSCKWEDKLFPSVTETVQIQNVVVGRMADGTVQAICEIITNTEGSYHSPFQVAWIEDPLFGTPSEGRAVQVVALRDILLVVSEEVTEPDGDDDDAPTTTAGFAYVWNYKGHGLFTKPHCVESIGRVKYAKLAIDSSGDLVVVAVLRGKKEVVVVKVSFDYFGYPDFDVVEEGEEKLKDLVLKSALLKDKTGHDTELHFTDSGKAMLLDAEGILRCVNPSDDLGPQVVQQRTLTKAFGKIATGSATESTKTGPIPFVVGSAPRADKPGMDDIHILFPGLDGVQQKVIATGEVVSLGSADSSPFVHSLFDLDPSDVNKGDLTAFLFEEDKTPASFFL